MEIVILATAKISEYLVEPIGRQASYLFCYSSNKRTLEREVENLGGIQNRVQHRVDEARRNGELIEDDVNRWLTKVNETSEEAKKFFEDEVEVNKSCLGGRCPNLISRYSLSREAKNKTRIVIGLIQKGSFETVSYLAPPRGIVHTPTGCFADFESRKFIIEEIMAALNDDNVNPIVVCGLGGIGKTTTVKEVGRRAEVENLFDEIVMAVIAQTPDFKKIQDEIADKLGLKFEEQSLPGRAERLRVRLMGCKRVLVILDDVWTRLDFEEVGIPFGAAHKGCKVMMTSRNEDVCKLETCKNFTIGVLSEEEAFYLFKVKAGNSVDSPDLYPIAKDVENECGALPIAIVTVGTALKGKTKPVWKDALLQLRHSSPENISGMQAKVYRSLELSYNFLESREAKSCLLLCCIFKEDDNIQMEDLVRYGMGLGLFKGVTELAEARDRVHALVDKLKSCYLLSYGAPEGCVKMHDVVRDVIRSIAMGGKDALMLRHGLELKEWPTKGTAQQYTSISLISNKIQELLLLESMDDSLEPPDNLFETIKELKVLELRRMFIPSPPPSLSLLTKLQTLSLQGCTLENVSVIGELETLIILSFRGCSIKELPREIGKLTHLRFLDLTGCTNLTIISPGVLSSLIRLEELYMDKSFVQWEVEEGSNERNNVNLAELYALSDHLVALQVHLPIAKFLSHFKKLVRFQIIIGQFLSSNWDQNNHIRNDLIINLDSGISVESGINNLLKKTETLHLQVQGVKNVFNDTTGESLVQLKALDLYCCRGLEYVIDTVDLVQQSIFPILESLKIFQADNLRMICHSQLPAGSFRELRDMDIRDLPKLIHLWKGPNQLVSLGNLRHITVIGCRKLENLFSQSIAASLVQLQDLQVHECEMIKEIVGIERGEIEFYGLPSIIRFPKLSHLSLYGLPSFVGFCKKLDEIEFPQLTTLELNGLPKLRSLCPSSLVSEGNLESDDIATQHLFNPKVKSVCELRSMTVSCCRELVNVFSSNSVQSLHNLEELKVKECDSLEVVFDFVGMNIERGHAAVTLSQLNNFVLSDLPKLIHVWKKLPQGIQGFQNLKSLNVTRCGGLTNLFHTSMTKCVVHLEELFIEDCEIMEEIVARGEEREEEMMDKIVIPQLKILGLSNLQNLTGFCQGLYAFDLPSLEDVIVEDCPKMKTFSFGFLSTPKLEKVQVGFDQEKSFWMGDLNNTIQQLFQRQELMVIQEIVPQEYDQPRDQSP